MLAAAEKLFVERGFAGTSMRDIAGESGISQPLIHHHFGSKEDLYRAIRRRAVDDYVARYPEGEFGREEPIDVRTEIGRMVEFWRLNPSILRLLNWARLEGNHNLSKEDSELPCGLVRRIALAQEAGLVRGDIGAANLSIMLMGLVAHWVENRAYFADIHPGQAADDADYIEQAIALVERGIAPR